MKGWCTNLEEKVKYRSISISWLKCSVCTLDTAVSREIQMKVSGKQVFRVFGLIIHFMVTNPKAQRCIFISKNQKRPGYQFILI